MDSRMKRWQRIIIESAKQCERNVLPEFFPPVSFSDLLGQGPEALKIIPYEQESSPFLGRSGMATIPYKHQSWP